MATMTTTIPPAIPTRTTGDSMEPFLRYQRQMILASLAVGVAATAGILLLDPAGPWYAHPYANGYLVGLTAALIALAAIDVPAILAIARGGANPARMYYVKMFKSLLVFGIALAAMLTRKEYFNAWSGLLGMVTPRLVLVADSILRPNLFPPPPTIPADAPPAQDDAAPRAAPSLPRDSEPG